MKRLDVLDAPPLGHPATVELPTREHLEVGVAGVARGAHRSRIGEEVRAEAGMNRRLPEGLPVEPETHRGQPVQQRLGGERSHAAGGPHRGVEAGERFKQGGRVPVRDAVPYREPHDSFPDRAPGAAQVHQGVIRFQQRPSNIQHRPSHIAHPTSHIAHPTSTPYLTNTTIPLFSLTAPEVLLYFT